jgi:hypothetical protein
MERMSSEDRYETRYGYSHNNLGYLHTIYDNQSDFYSHGLISLKDGELAEMFTILLNKIDKLEQKIEAKNAVVDESPGLA